MCTSIESVTVYTRVQEMPTVIIFKSKACYAIVKFYSINHT